MDSDQREIDELMRRFFSAFRNQGGTKPDLASLHGLFVENGIIIKNSGPVPEIFNVAQFILPRERILNDGTLTEFAEEEFAERTTRYGNIAQRISLYRKSGILNGEPFQGRGVKTTQLIRTADGWKITALAWDDQRDGFQVPEAL